MTNAEKIKSLLSDIGLLDKFRIEVDHQNDYVLAPVNDSAQDIMATMLHLAGNGFGNFLYNGEIVIYKSADTIIPVSGDPAEPDVPDQH